MKAENKIQQEIFRWYKNNYCLAIHKPRQIIFHVPNQNQHNLVNIGVLPGVADLFCTILGVMVFVEVKDEKGRQSENQIRFQKHCEDMGISYYLVRSLEEFQEIVNFRHENIERTKLDQMIIEVDNQIKNLERGATNNQTNKS